MGVLHCDVAIVGGGASGALVAAGMLRRLSRSSHAGGSAPPKWTFALIDGEGAFARGVAYSTSEPRHVLNVPAAKMGADPSDVGGFLRWANARGVLAGPGDFLPRMLYGEYLEDVLSAAEQRSSARLVRLKARVEELVRVPDQTHARVDSMELGSADSGQHAEAPHSNHGTRTQTAGRRGHARDGTTRGKRANGADRGGGASSSETRWILRTSEGEVHARIVVIATGNLAPANPPVPDGGLYESERYIASAWKPESLRDIRADEDVFFIGTGLTTVDALLTLSGWGHRGRLIALSPHGMFPRVHTGDATQSGADAVDTLAANGSTSPPPANARVRSHPSPLTAAVEADARTGRTASSRNGNRREAARQVGAGRSSVEPDASRGRSASVGAAEFETAGGAPRVRELLRRVRQLSREHDWRGVIDALRPHTIPIWTALADMDRRRFLRHLRHFWEVHRHRMAPDVARVLDELRDRDQLEVVIGRLVAFEPDGADGVIVRYRPRGEPHDRTVQVSRVVNCTGPRSPFVGTETFFASMLRRGFARPDPLRLGFETIDGVLVGADGEAQADLFAIGPLRRGELWETTAIPEIRVQADELAERITSELSARDVTEAGRTEPA